MNNDNHQNQAEEQLQTEETLGSYSRALDPLHHSTSLHHFGMPYTGSALPLTTGGTYDDLHKYGGIGKKLHSTSLYDHGNKGKIR